MAIYEHHLLGCCMQLCPKPDCCNLHFGRDRNAANGNRFFRRISSVKIEFLMFMETLDLLVLNRINTHTRVRKIKFPGMGNSTYNVLFRSSQREISHFLKQSSSTFLIASLFFWCVHLCHFFVGFRSPPLNNKTKQKRTFKL